VQLQEALEQRQADLAELDRSHCAALTSQAMEHSEAVTALHAAAAEDKIAASSRLTAELESNQHEQEQQAAALTADLQTAVAARNALRMQLEEQLESSAREVCALCIAWLLPTCSHCAQTLLRCVSTTVEVRAMQKEIAVATTLAECDQKRTAELREASAAAVVQIARAVQAAEERHKHELAQAVRQLTEEVDVLQRERSAARARAEDSDRKLCKAQREATAAVDELQRVRRILLTAACT
jgi:hypothetical protein